MATACVVAGGTLLGYAQAADRTGPPPAPPAAARAPAPSGGTPSGGAPSGGAQPPTARPASPPAPLPRSEPVSLAIPRIGLDTAVEHTGNAPDGSVALPADPRHAAWYAPSVTPGERGNSILVGHLDSRTGPAAFYGLGALRPGDTVTVTRRDGRHVPFTVTGQRVWNKTGFPADEVYAPTPDAQLTLITCADWDARTHTYRSNLVITARPAGSP